MKSQFIATIFRKPEKSDEPPRIIQPPPSKSARLAKERQWLALIGSSKGKHLGGAPSSASLDSRSLSTASSSAPSTSKRVGKKRSFMGFMNNGRVHDETPGKNRLLVPVMPAQGRSVISKTSAESFALVHPQEAPASTSNRLSAVTLKAKETTTSLALQLQELSVAHEDGLISDEEYRLLRQALFTRMTQADGFIAGSGVLQTALSASDDTMRPLTGTSVRRKPSSIRSARSSINTVFRKARSRPSIQLEDDWRDLNVAHHEALDTSGDAIAVLSGSNTFSSSKKLSTGLKRFLSPQEAVLEDDFSAMVPPRTSTSSFRRIDSSRPSSVRSGLSSIGMSRTAYSSSSSRSASLPPSIEDDVEASIPDIRLEIMQLEAERDRLCTGFVGIETNLIEQMRACDSMEAIKRQCKRIQETQRKRDTVTRRYDQRLDHLRERLRAAKLREKLVKQ